jgi:hypothetical protein
VAGLLLGLAACAPAAGNKAAPVPPAPAASAPAAILRPLQIADLPAELGGLARGKTKTYETPGQGVSVAYAGTGMEATVSLYDAGIKNLPEELGAPVVVREFQDSLNEIQVWIQAGWARDVQMRESYVLENSGQPQFLCAELEIAAKSGLRDSYLFLTSHQGQFVKVRMTGAAEKNTKARAVGFAQALGRILWPEAKQ